MVNCAVALPLASNVTELGLIEHVGEPASAGCTEQVKEAGLSKAFSKLRLTVDVALCPGLTVLGLSLDAAIEKSVLIVFRNTLMLLLTASVTIISGDLLPSRSAIEMAFV